MNGDSTILRAAANIYEQAFYSLPLYIKLLQNRVVLLFFMQDMYFLLRKRENYVTLKRGSPKFEHQVFCYNQQLEEISKL